jgi:hypothetical protein
MAASGRPPERTESGWADPAAPTTGDEAGGWREGECRQNKKEEGIMDRKLSNSWSVELFCFERSGRSTADSFKKKKQE